MKKVTFENKFHNTEITMIPKANKSHVDYRECECCGHVGDYGSDFETSGDKIGGIYMCQKCYDDDTLTDTLE